MSTTEITLAEAGAGLPARAGTVRPGAVRPGTVLRGALRVIGAILIATIALVLLLASLAPGGIGACAQGPAAGATAAGPAARAEPPPAAGLFFRAARDDMVLEAPTLMTDVRIAVTGLISRVTVRQHFVNPSDAWMEGIYCSDSNTWFPP